MGEFCRCHDPDSLSLNSFSGNSVRRTNIYNRLTDSSRISNLNVKRERSPNFMNAFSLYNLNTTTKLFVADFFKIVY